MVCLMASFDPPTDGDTSQRQPASGLWQNRDFLLLFSAQVISLLGSGVTTVGLALFAYELTGGKSATAIVGTALMLRILAFLLFSQPAGVLADRISRKHILIVMDLGRFALLACFPFVTQVWQIYLLIFLTNALTAGFTPTFEATIPQIVGPQHYPQALSLSRVAVDVEAVASPVFAGLLIAAFGVRWVFWADSLTYLMSAGLILLVAIPRTQSTQTSWWTGLATDIFHGSRILLREPSLRQALMLSFAEATAGAAAIVATVVSVRDTLGKGEFAFVATMAAVGLGSSVAALFLGRIVKAVERPASGPAELHRTRHRWTSTMLLVGGLILGAVLLPGVLLPPLWLFAFLWLFNGVGQALVGLSSSVLLAEHTADHERGRAYAAHFALTHACWLFTYPAIGYAAMSWGAPLTFTLAGLLCLATTAIAFFAGWGTHAPHTHEL